MAIGNVIGSNLSISFCIGVQRQYHSLHLSGITNFDLFTLVGSSILLWLFGLFFCQADHYTDRRKYYDTLLCGVYGGTDL